MRVYDSSWQQKGAFAHVREPVARVHFPTGSVFFFNESSRGTRTARATTWTSAFFVASAAAPARHQPQANSRTILSTSIAVPFSHIRLLTVHRWCTPVIAAIPAWFGYRGNTCVVRGGHTGDANAVLPRAHSCVFRTGRQSHRTCAHRSHGRASGRQTRSCLYFFFWRNTLRNPTISHQQQRIAHT